MHTYTHKHTYTYAHTHLATGGPTLFPPITHPKCTHQNTHTHTLSQVGLHTSPQPHNSNYTHARTHKHTLFATGGPTNNPTITAATSSKPHKGFTAAPKLHHQQQQQGSPHSLPGSPALIATAASGVGVSADSTQCKEPRGARGVAVQVGAHFCWKSASVLLLPLKQLSGFDSSR
jgi:hypothetical protein